MKVDKNRNLENLKPSATLAINEKVKTLKAEHKEIVHFGFGQSPFAIHEDIVNALKNSAHLNHYMSSFGLRELREQISWFLKNHQGLSRASDLIYIGPGSKELLYHTILLLEGDVIIPKGSWVSYGPQVKLKGRDYKVIDTQFSNDFKLSPTELVNFCNQNPETKKILIINSPNNPTGAIYDEEELEKN